MSSISQSAAAQQKERGVRASEEPAAERSWSGFGVVVFVLARFPGRQTHIAFA